MQHEREHRLRHRRSALIALGSLLALALPAFAQEPGGNAHAEAHPAPAPGGAVESSEDVKKVTTRVLCMCGGCVNQSVHECTCGMAASEREKVAGEIASGKSPEAVIKQYIEQHGLQVLVTPEKSGFNLVGWLVPFAAALAGLTVLTVIIRGWVRLPRVAAAGAAGIVPPLSDDSNEKKYRERLEKELKEFEA